MESHLKHGPGYRSPLEAMKGPREKIMYTVLIYYNTAKITAIVDEDSNLHCGPETEDLKPDCFATIDVDPNSPTYSQVIHKLEMPYTGDELHHFNWNVCSSCCDDETKSRRYLIVPGFKSSRIYILDTIEPVAPKIHKIIEPNEVKLKTNLSAPHTVHCLPNGNIMISMLGDKDGNSPGGFLLLDENFDILGRYGKDGHKNVKFNYDFWYQPFHNVMVSSELAAPKTFFPRLNLSDVAINNYGHHINFWNWSEEKLIKSIDLGLNGEAPVEIRFLHNPQSKHGYVVAAVSGAVWHFYFDEDKQDWKAENVFQTYPAMTIHWPFVIPAFTSFLLVSLDDRFLYIINWLHGDIRQLDITDPHKPKQVGQLFVGGQIGKEYHLQGKKLQAGPQMMQLSLDGKRLYVQNSFLSTWDNQFYPDLAKTGSHMLLVHCDTEKGGMVLDESFFVSYEKIDGKGPYKAHELRYPGGDCTSDIWTK